MKWSYVQLGVVALSVASFSPCLASPVKRVYGLESAMNYHSRAHGNFYIQAAAFSHQSNAERYQRLLRSKTAHPVTIAHKNNLYLVIIGPMNSALELRKTAVALRSAAQSRMVIKNNRSQVQESQVMLHHVAPKQANNIPIAKEKDAPVSPAANWFITIGSGAAFPTAKGDLFINNGSLFPAPYDVDIYTTHQSASALINVTAGRRWERNGQWISAFSLGVLYQHSFLGGVDGTVTQYSLPEFTNYDYSWDLSSDIVLATAKVNIHTPNRFSPYVTAGLGGAFNHSRYSETALPGVTPRTSPGFSGNNSQFAYNVGAGIDFRAANYCIINLGYLYQNVGNISAHGRGLWSNTSFGLGTYGFNEVVAGATYLFDK